MTYLLIEMYIKIIGLIDVEDLTLIDNDVFNYAYGYNATDLNGDNYIDITDYSIGDNNVFKFCKSDKTMRNR